MRFNQLLRKIVGGEDGNEERKGEEERGERSERKRALNVGKTYALQQNTCFTSYIILKNRLRC